MRLIPSIVYDSDIQSYEILGDRLDFLTQIRTFNYIIDLFIQNKVSMFPASAVGNIRIFDHVQ